MIIDRVGGLEALNQRFQGWGLKGTSLQAVLPDLEGTNLTTPKELAMVIGSVEQGELVSRRSRDLVMSIMQRTENDTLLPKGIEKNATIAHKTGNLGTLVADAGLIDMPNGKRYLLVVMVKRPRNDQQGAELIRQISRTTYNYFKQVPPSSKP
jgi:beta-lactamase class A